MAKSSLFDFLFENFSYITVKFSFISSDKHFIFQNETIQIVCQSVKG